MTIKVLLLDKNKGHINLLKQKEEYRQFSFISHKNTDVLDCKEQPIGFEYHPDNLVYLDKIMSSTPFQFVVATSESQIQFAGLLRARYGLVNGPDATLSTNVTNKLSMRRRLANCVRSPIFWHSGEFLRLASVGATDLPDTVVIKPIYGSSSKGVKRFTLTQALTYLKSQPSLFIVEEYIPLDRELHCDGVILDGRLDFVILSQYARPWLEDGIQSNASIHLTNDDPQYQPTIRFIREVLDELGIKNGVFHIELFDYREQLYFGEIGLRPGGGGIADSIRYFFDVDIWDCYMKLALNMNLVLPPQQKVINTSGYIGISESDLQKNNAPFNNTILCNSITLRTPHLPHQTGCMAYKELLFFTCKSVHEIMSDFAKLKNAELKENR